MRIDDHAALPARNGFTFLELSIVMVIIGLLIGGVLTGKELIGSSEMKTIGSRMSAYNAALINFREKYNAIPGDMSNATSYWTSDSNCNTVTMYAAAGTTATCNGDGNGHVDSSASAIEWWRLPQHLANAGMIQGIYSGRGADPSASSTGGLYMGQADLNLPGLPRAGVLQTMWVGTITSTADATYYEGSYANMTLVGEPVSKNLSTGPLMTTSEAYNFDLKYDDGKPGTGTMVTYKPAGTQLCATTTSSATALYNFSRSGQQCALMVRGVL